jgi:hypothetical protein
VRTSKSVMVRMDPRVNTPPEGLDEQFRLSMQLNDAFARVQRGLARPSGATGVSSPAAALEPMRQLHADLLLTYEALQEVDVAPTAAVGWTVGDLLKRVDGCCPEVSTR